MEACLLHFESSLFNIASLKSPTKLLKRKSYHMLFKSANQCSKNWKFLTWTTHACLRNHILKFTESWVYFQNSKSSLFSLQAPSQWAKMLHPSKASQSSSSLIFEDLHWEMSSCQHTLMKSFFLQQLHSNLSTLTWNILTSIVSQIPLSRASVRMPHLCSFLFEHSFSVRSFQSPSAFTTQV